MKFLITSDWHVDTFTNGVERFDELAHVVDQMINYAQTNEIKYFVFMGDYHNPNCNQWYKYQSFLIDTAKRLENSCIHSIWLVGNHDITKTDKHVLSILKSIQNDSGYSPILVEKPGLINIKSRGSKINLIGLPFPNDNNSIDYNDILEKIDNKKQSIVFSHLSIEGAQLGSESFDMARGSTKLMPYGHLITHLKNPIIFQGHYHKKQTIIKPQSKVYVVGSPYRVHFDEEENEPGFYVFDTDKGIKQFVFSQDIRLMNTFESDDSIWAFFTKAQIEAPDIGIKESIKKLYHDSSMFVRLYCPDDATDHHVSFALSYLTTLGCVVRVMPRSQQKQPVIEQNITHKSIRDIAIERLTEVHKKIWGIDSQTVKLEKFLEVGNKLMNEQGI